MKYDANKSKFENWLDFGIVVVKSFFCLWILIPILFFLWKCSF